MNREKVIEWLKDAAIRAVKTVAQSAVATIGTTAATLGEVEWLMVASTAALSGVLSLLMSVANMPIGGENDKDDAE